MPPVSTQKIALQLLHPHKHPKLTSMKSALWRSLGDVVSAVKSEVNQVKIRTWVKIGNVFFWRFWDEGFVPQIRYEWEMEHMETNMCKEETHGKTRWRPR